jgi:hypothetical protein
MPQENAWIELTARVCHEANRVMQLAADEEQLSPKWDNAPEWQKESAIEGVKAALTGQSASMLHESWRQKKIADGWVWGPVKDGDKKTHPALVGYLRLPDEQKMKDHMFRAIVSAFEEAKVLGKDNLKSEES